MIFCQYRLYRLFTQWLKQRATLLSKEQLNLGLGGINNLSQTGFANPVQPGSSQKS